MAKFERELLDILEYTKECAENYIPTNINSLINSINSICNGKYSAKLAEIGNDVEVISISTDVQHIANIWIRDRQESTAYIYKLYIMYPGIYIYDLTREGRILSSSQRTYIENFFN